MTQAWRTAPLMKSHLVALVLVCLGLYSCSSNVDPVITNGFAVLDAAYASDVKPIDASVTRCTTGEWKSRHVALCGISYGADELAQVGAWEIVQADGKFTVYAMNGKALQALEKMTRSGSLTATAYPGVFNPGTTRPVLDVSEVRALLLKK